MSLCGMAAVGAGADAVDVEFYGPAAATSSAYCVECPQCCGLDGSSTGAQSPTTQLVISFTVAALLSCILHV